METIKIEKRIINNKVWYSAVGLCELFDVPNIISVDDSEKYLLETKEDMHTKWIPYISKKGIQQLLSIK